MAGFVQTMESNLRTAMGVEICKAFYYHPHFCKPLAKTFTDLCSNMCLGICSDQKCDVSSLQIYKGYSICLTAQFQH